MQAITNAKNPYRTHILQISYIYSFIHSSIARMRLDVFDNKVKYVYDTVLCTYTKVIENKNKIERETNIFIQITQYLYINYDMTSKDFILSHKCSKIYKMNLIF